MIVPSRNDAPAGLDLHARSRAHEISGKTPGFTYEMKSTDASHPQYFGNYLKRREIGNDAIGYTFVDPWEIVHEGEVDQGRKRADDTKGVDTKVTHGSLVLMRTPDANAAKTHYMNNLMVETQSRSLHSNERKQIDQTRFGAQVFSGDGTSGAHAAPVVSSQLTGGK